MRKHYLFLSSLFFVLPAITGFNKAFSQKALPAAVFQKAFRNTSSFIENVGQYTAKVAGAENMGRVEFGFEGFDMPVVFTTKEMIFFHRKTKGPSEEQLEKMYRNQVPAEVIASKVKVTYQTIFAEWVGANPSATIITQNQTEGKHTYAGVQQQATSFSKITIRDAYPGIDIVYSIDPGNVNGFEYSIIARPGADITQV